jgi:ferritin-like metal-binding protein YciE
MPGTPPEQLVRFLSDMYSVELQALVQMESAAGLAGDPTLAADFRTHCHETQRQVELVRNRLEAAGGSPSAVKDAVMKLGGKAFLLFARIMPETPGRLVAHAYSYEAMEWAGYEMLRRFAERAEDAETAAAARAIGAEERTMMHRLERGFDAAERASHGRDLDGASGPDTHAHVRKHLAEAHALEAQSSQLLEKAAAIAGEARLSDIYARHLVETRGHARQIEQRLQSLGGSPSALEDAALRIGGFNWGLFFQAQSDTPAKLAAFVYAVEHLEIGGYELLRRSARRARDAETENLCESILEEERLMAGRLAAAFDVAADATLDSAHALR